MNSKIKFFLILTIVILGIGVYGYFRATPGLKNATGNSPKIEVEPKSFDFGDIKYGDIVSHSFKVKNLGNETLEIKRTATSCSCTTAKIEKEKINPGEEVNLLVTYNSGLMGISHGKGPQERIIFIQSDDPITPQIEVLIYANLK